MNNRKRLMEAALLILAVAGMICYGTKGAEEWEENHTGIPDAVSSMSSNNWQYLKVVANSDRIKDKEALNNVEHFQLYLDGKEIGFYE